MLDSANSSRAIALTALGMAAFSVGFSLSVVACSKAPGVDIAGEANTSVQSGAPTTRASAVASTRPDSIPEVPLEPSPEPEPKAKEKASAPGPIRVKRLLVTDRIEGREPVAATLAVTDEVIYAFAEVENPAGDERRIRISFEHDGKRPIGNVPLSVPASHKRFRTWGGTRLIDQPGRWQAVVRADDGTELARASFDVES
jgi:hypothetical protein